MTRHLAVLALLLPLGGCAGFGEVMASTLAMEYPDEQSMPQPSDSEGAIIVYGVGGRALSSFIYEHDERIAVIDLGTYTHFSASPGRHEYTVYVGNRGSIIIDVHPGEVYYVRYRVDEGALNPRPQLELVPRETGEATVPTLKYARRKNH